MSIQTDDFAPAPARRMVSAAPASPNEEAVERALRPKLLDEYVGQTKIREQLDVPVFLAGGLRAENVREAVERVAPFGLDVCSGVRTGGRLDERKLSALFSELERCS